MARIYLFSAAALVAAMLGGLLYVVVMGGPASDDQFAQCRASQVASGSGDIGGPFELVHHEGHTVTEEDVITKPTLIYFGYTFCPDVCPLDNARNAQAVQMLSERGRDAQPVFITVDPKRDTPEVMADFVPAFHPEMIGLTGSDEQVRAAAQAYRAFYNAHEADDDFYLVDHSTFTYLMMPEHGFVEVFRRDEGVEALADRVACYIDAA